MGRIGLEAKHHGFILIPGFKFWKILLYGLTVCPVWKGEVHYGVVSEEPDITLYHVWHIIYMYKRNRQGPWGTPDMIGVRLLAFMHNSFGSVWKKRSKSDHNIYAKRMELQQEPFLSFFFFFTGSINLDHNSLCPHIIIMLIKGLSDKKIKNIINYLW